MPRANGLTISDYARCKWPDTVTGKGAGHGGVRVAQWADGLNDVLRWPEDVRRRMRRACSTAAEETGGVAEQLGAEQRHKQDVRTEMDEVGDGASTARAPDQLPHVISMSHFVPDIRLNPEKRFLTYPNLVSKIGSG